MNGTELLPSWSQGAAKSAVPEFVESVSRPGASYVPPAERIATFDNDGTLWCEKPLYVEANFVFRRWKQMVEADPAKAWEQPYKALVENDQAWLKNLLDHVPDLVKDCPETAYWRRSGRTTSTTVCRLLSRRATGRRSNRTSRPSKRSKRTKGPEGDRVMDPRGRLPEEDACSSLSLPSP